MQIPASAALRGRAIDLDEIAMPEIFDPRQVKWLRSGLCSLNVLGALCGLRQRQLRPPPLAGCGKSRDFEKMAMKRA
jgi:hypothetical protein